MERVHLRPEKPEPLKPKKAKKVRFIKVKRQYLIAQVTVPSWLIGIIIILMAQKISTF